jgi:acetyltransferase-like isoleucine patch superfamily enzyme
MHSKIARTAHICDGVKIGENVIIDDNVYIDYDVIIRDNVHIKEGTFIGAHSILGEYLSDFFDSKSTHGHRLTIGKNSIIRSETIIYSESEIGDSFQTGHRVTIREHADIGSHVRIGTLSDIQGYCEIQDYVNIHSNVHIGQKSFIKKYAWLFPYVVLTNDPTPPSMNMCGVTIDEFAVIATGSVILPGKKIGRDTLVGAGSIVTKDVEPLTVVAGNPAKMLCKVTDIKDKKTGKNVYPWRYNFDRRMPWENIGYDEWKKEQ